MNKNNKIMAIVAAAIIILGLGGIYIYNQNQAAVPEKIAEVKEAGKELSIKEILSTKGNQECTFKHSDDKGSSEGVAYFTEGKLRVDFTVTNEAGKATSMSLIRDGEENYIWGEEMENGVKLVLSDETFSSSGQIEKYFDTDTERKTTTVCKTWSVDNSKFEPPTDVEFIDLTSFQVPQAESEDDSDSSTQCGYCNALTGDAKNVCLKSFNCPQ